MMELILPPHYESNIITVQHPEHGLIIKKQYKEDHPCVQWLNQYLANFYNVDAVLPIVAHEKTLLTALEPYGIVPKLYDCTKNSIFLEVAGNPIHLAKKTITKENYRFQAKNILAIFGYLGIKHNDLLEGNILLHDGIIRIIDFTLAEYANIQVGRNLPDKSWARVNMDHQILLYDKYFTDKLDGEMLAYNRDAYKEIAKSVYNYHNLGVGHYDEAMNEKTPKGYGERYNFDRFSMMIQHYDFTNKNVFDIGCNSGWFCFQTKLLGGNTVLGLDFINEGVMGEAFRYAYAFEAYLQSGVKFINQRIETLQCPTLLYCLGIENFDAIFLLSVLHHVTNKRETMLKIYSCCKDVIFYEYHEFWNEIYDDEGNLLSVEGKGHRYDWNKDLSWRKKMGSLKKHEPLVINSFMKSWRKNDLLLKRYSNIELLGFSEKRRPLLALHK